MAVRGGVFIFARQRARGKQAQGSEPPTSTGYLGRPLAYRGEARVVSRLPRGDAGEQAFRPGPGDPGHADTENSGIGAAERLGDRAAPEADFQRSFGRERRVALPRTAQAGTKGLDHGRVESD